MGRGARTDEEEEELTLVSAAPGGILGGANVSLDGNLRLLNPGASPFAFSARSSAGESPLAFALVPSYLADAASDGSSLLVLEDVPKELTCSARLGVCDCSRGGLVGLCPHRTIVQQLRASATPALQRVLDQAPTTVEETQVSGLRVHSINGTPIRVLAELNAIGKEERRFAYALNLPIQITDPVYGQFNLAGTEEQWSCPRCKRTTCPLPSVGFEPVPTLKKNQKPTPFTSLLDRPATMAGLSNGIWQHAQLLGYTPILTWFPTKKPHIAVFSLSYATLTLARWEIGRAAFCSLCVSDACLHVEIARTTGLI